VTSRLPVPFSPDREGPRHRRRPRDRHTHVRSIRGTTGRETAIDRSQMTTAGPKSHPEERTHTTSSNVSPPVRRRNRAGHQTPRERARGSRSCAGSIPNAALVVSVVLANTSLTRCSGSQLQLFSRARSARFFSRRALQRGCLERAGLQFPNGRVASRSAGNPPTVSRSLRAGHGSKHRDRQGPLAGSPRLTRGASTFLDCAGCCYRPDAAARKLSAPRLQVDRSNHHLDTTASGVTQSSRGAADAAALKRPEGRR